MKNVIIVSAILLSVLHSKAQSSKQTRDSIYYLIDTAKTPVNDRLWDIHDENNLVFYTFQCSCLMYGGNPTFVYSSNKPAQVPINSLKGIRLISIVGLLKLIKQSEGEKFNTKHVLYFIQPSNEGYIKRQVRAFRNQEPIKDYEIIKAKADSAGIKN